MDIKPIRHSFDGFYYRILNDKEIELTSYDPLPDYIQDEICVVIPEMIDGLPVTSLRASLFHCNRELPIRKVVLSSSLAHIYGNPFSDLPLLQEVIIPENNHAFVMSDDGVLFSSDQKQLIAMVMRDQLSYAVPEGTEMIHAGAFANCLLEKVYVPETVKSIGEAAFYQCTLLVSVRFPSDGIKEIPDWCFNECSQLAFVNIPSSVCRIGDGVFSGCKRLPELKIPDLCKEIGEFAFSYCQNLRSIHIPDSVRRIKCYSFFHASSLARCVLPASLEMIEEGAFEGCDRLVSLVIPESVKTIEERAFPDKDHFLLLLKKGSAAEKYAAEQSLNYMFN